ncbi:MAG: signal peptide peptidase SppA [Rhizobiaceae bacterium]|nr:signal peptide peptidase SppA [Rhizobiaceae bacterium]
MAITADELIDRRQLRKKISFWRVLTFMIAALALIAMMVFAARDTIFSASNEDHIARIKITGVITNDEPMLKLLKAVKDEERVKAVILHVSSPGGSTVGGEAMYEAVRELAEAKPTVTSVGTLAASAGYMIAAATDHIVARRSSIVGSIGVLFQYADATELLGKIGVTVNSVKSSPLKAEPSPFNTTSPEAVAMIDRVIKDTYQWFVDLVTERRGMTPSQINAVADGSIFTGNQGVQNGLIDELGGQEVAVKWLETEKEIAEDLEVVEYKPKRPGDSIFDNPAALVQLARQFGIEINGTDVKEFESELRERLFLDGLVSIWQSPR